MKHLFNVNFLTLNRFLCGNTPIRHRNLPLWFFTRSEVWTLIIVARKFELASSSITNQLFAWKSCVYPKEVLILGLSLTLLWVDQTVQLLNVQTAPLEFTSGEQNRVRSTKDKVEKKCGCWRTDPPYKLYCFPSLLRNNDKRKRWIAALRRVNKDKSAWKP